MHPNRHPPGWAWPPRSDDAIAVWLAIIFGCVIPGAVAIALLVAIFESF